MATVLENLQKARDLIAKPENWCIAVFERDNRSGGRAYCALGAISKVKYDCALKGFAFIGGECEPEMLALDATIDKEEYEEVGAMPHDRARIRVPNYNNALDHGRVLNWFDRAIEIQKEHPTEKVG
jgi:hypothetical protein